MEEYIPLLLASGDLPVQHTLFSFYENEVYKMDRLKIPQIQENTKTHVYKLHI